jgi:hypothetical protein
MIKQPYIFNEAEAATISMLMADDQKDVWSDSLVDELRSKIKKYYIKEQNYQCCYCCQTLVSDNGRVWDAEHILTRQQYRQYTFESRNLAIACVDCNIAKGTKPVLKGATTQSYPEQAAKFTICHPHFDEWTDHLDAIGQVIIVPKTEKGRQTIEVCNLYRLYMKSVGIEIDRVDMEFEPLLDKVGSDNANERRLALLELKMLIDNALKKTPFG